MRKKKLQVFISSTFTDLIEERQAAVQAILSCGHIPAGMELFTAGDESQMKVIKRWIEDSDVYLLILGGRYGSIEPKSGKSYTHLEYDYAVSLEKPLFAVVINENALDNKVSKDGKSVLELENPQKLKDFRGLVLSKMVEFFDDIKDIELAIYKTMSEYERRELIGWVRDDQAVDTANLLEQMTRLTKENMSLREQLASSKTETYNGLSFEELSNILQQSPIDSDAIHSEEIEGVKTKFESQELNLLHYFYLYIEDQKKLNKFEYVNKLVRYGLIEDVYRMVPDSRTMKYELSDDGKKFWLRLLAKFSNKTDALI